MKLIVEQKIKTKIGINQLTLAVALLVSSLGFIFSFAFVIYNGTAKLTAWQPIRNNYQLNQDTSGVPIDIINKLDINKIFTKNESLFLDIQKNILAFSISGNVSFNQPAGFARVILVDANDDRYLLYNSAGSMGNNEYFFADACKEACYLNNIKPVALQIQASEAKITISTIQYLTKANGYANLNK